MNAKGSLEIQKVQIASESRIRTLRISNETHTFVYWRSVSSMILRHHTKFEVSCGTALIIQQAAMGKEIYHTFAKTLCADLHGLETVFDKKEVG